MSDEPRDRGRRDGVRLTLPLGIAVLGFGVSYGVLARSAGMGWRAAPGWAGSHRL